MSTIRESDLPGIGRKFQIEAQNGDKLIVVVHDDGRRELYHFDPNDPDELLSMVTLNDTEARQVAGITGGLNYTPKALETMTIILEGLVIKWYKIEPASALIGQTIGQLQVRQPLVPPLWPSSKRMAASTSTLAPTKRSLRT